MAETITPFGKHWRIIDGKLMHDGDCAWWSKEICTCGLIHYCLPHAERLKDLYPWLEAQAAMQEKRLRQIK
jgi:hypothetical protein